MKHILCYGDSNTWGSAAYDGRIADDKQWPNILGAQLGAGYKVLQEGLCGRFAGEVETDERAFKNGQYLFEALYRSATPVDVLIVALGTNDLKRKYGRSAQTILADIMWLVKTARSLDHTNEGSVVQVIIVAPANFVSHEDYYNGDEVVWRELLELLQTSGEVVLAFDDLPMTEDGVHYSEAAHALVAEAIYNKVKELQV